jgi:hypothetical protein
VIYIEYPFLFPWIQCLEVTIFVLYGMCRPNCESCPLPAASSSRVCSIRSSRCSSLGHMLRSLCNDAGRLDLAAFMLWNFIDGNLFRKKAGIERWTVTYKFHQSKRKPAALLFDDQPLEKSYHSAVGSYGSEAVVLSLYRSMGIAHSEFCIRGKFGVD